MEKDNRSVVERLEDIETQQEQIKNQNEQISELLNNLNNKNSGNRNNVVQPQRDNKEVLNSFIKSAKKEYMWLGTNVDFNRGKSKIILIGLFIILSSILASVLTALSCKFFSIASLFELWWTILVINIMIHHVKMRKKMRDTELMGLLCNEYEIDTKNNVVLDTLVESSIYKWSRILSYIAAGVNCILLLTFVNIIWLTVIALLVEISYLVLVIVFNVLRVNFDDMYDTFSILLTGMNETKTEEVKLVLDLTHHKIITFEEYKKIFPYEDF